MCVRHLLFFLVALVGSPVVVSTSLTDAIKNENLKQLKGLLTSGYHHVNSKDSEGNTPLHIAAESGNKEVIEALLNAGAHVNAKNEKGLSALSVATLNDKVEAMKALLDAGAKISPDALGEAKTAAADRAQQVTNPSGGTFLDLLMKGVGVETAVEMELFEVLLGAGADVDVRYENGRTPLQDAVEVGDLQMVEKLIKAGADVNAKNDEGQSPLHSAAIQKQPEITEALIKAGANVDAQDEQGKTPFDVALDYRADNTSEVLARAQAKLHDDIPPPNYMMYEAAAHNLSLTLKALADVHGDINFANSSEHDGGTPLHGAVIAGDLAMVKALIDMGADLNAQNNRGRTPGFLAVMLGRLDLVEALVKANAHWTKTPDFSYELPEDVTTQKEILKLLPKELGFFGQWWEIFQERGFFCAIGAALLGSLPMTALLVFAERGREKEKSQRSSSAEEPSPGAQQLAATAITGASAVCLMLRCFEIVTAMVLPAWTFGYWIAPWVTGSLLLVVYILPSTFVVGFKKALRFPALFLVSSPLSLVRNRQRSLDFGVPLAFFRCTAVLLFPLAVVISTQNPIFYNWKYEGPQINIRKLMGNPNYYGDLLCFIDPYDGKLLEASCLGMFVLVHMLLPFLLFLIGLCCCGCVCCCRCCRRRTAANMSSEDLEAAKKTSPAEKERQVRELARQIDRVASEAPTTDQEVYKKVAEVLEKHKEGSQKLVSASSWTKFWTTPYFDLTMMGIDFFSDLYTMQNIFFYHHWWFGGILLMMLVSSTTAEVVSGNTPQVLLQEAHESARLGFRTARFKSMQQHEATWEALPSLAISVYAFWFSVKKWSQVVLSLGGLLMSIRGLALFLHQKLDLELPDFDEGNDEDKEGLLKAKE